MPDTKPKHGLVGGEASHNIRQTVGISRWPVQTNLTYNVVPSSSRAQELAMMKARLDLRKPPMLRSTDV